MNISFAPATNRNTKCYQLYVGNCWFGISYQTVVAASGPFNGTEIRKARRENSWGPTTGRHLKELHAYDWPILEEKEFTKMVSDMLDQDVLSRIQRRLEA